MFSFSGLFFIYTFVTKKKTDQNEEENLFPNRWVMNIIDFILVSNDMGTVQSWIYCTSVLKYSSSPKDEGLGVRGWKKAIEGCIASGLEFRALI